MSSHRIINNDMFEVREDGSLKKLGNIPVGMNLSEGIKQLLPKETEPTIEVKVIKKPAKPRKKKVKDAI